MNRARVIVLAVVSCLAALTSAAPTAQPEHAMPKTPDLPALRVYDISTKVDGQRYACKVMVNEAATLGGPALLFLHGSGECGTDGVRQLHVGLPRYAMEDPKRWPFVIIAPQKPTVNSEWEDHDKAVMALLDKAAQLGLYDPDRLGITGLSQGGHGTIAIAGLHPDRFKAVASVCAYVRPVYDKDRNRIDRPAASADDPVIIAAAEKIAKLPVWVHHGDSDSVVPVSEARALFGALRALHADARYSEYPDVDHNSWDHAYVDRDFSEWFREHLVGGDRG